MSAHHSLCNSLTYCINTMVDGCFTDTKCFSWSLGWKLEDSGQTVGPMNVYSTSKVGLLIRKCWSQTCSQKLFWTMWVIFLFFHNYVMTHTRLSHLRSITCLSFVLFLGQDVSVQDYVSVFVFLSYVFLLCFSLISLGYVLCTYTVV